MFYLIHLNYRYKNNNYYKCSKIIRPKRADVNVKLEIIIINYELKVKHLIQI